MSDATTPQTSMLCSAVGFAAITVILRFLLPLKEEPEPRRRDRLSLTSSVAVDISK